MSIFILFIIPSSRHMNNRCLAHCDAFSHMSRDGRLFTERAHSSIRDAISHFKNIWHHYCMYLLKIFSVFLAYYHSMVIYSPSNLNVLQPLQLNPKFAMLESLHPCIHFISFFANFFFAWVMKHIPTKMQTQRRIWRGSHFAAPVHGPAGVITLAAITITSPALVCP